MYQGSNSKPALAVRRGFKLTAMLVLFLTLAALMLNPLTQNTAQAGDDSRRDLDSWGSWGHDTFNSRFNPFSRELNQGNIRKLDLKWAFVFPDTAIASSQPAIVGDTLYVGSWNGKVYALNAKNGQLRWTYDTTSYTHLPAGLNAVRTGIAVEDGKVYFGDLLANIYALDAKTGAFKWATKVESHPQARITGSPLVWQNRLFVGVSSGETAAALDPSYPCCSFRGSMVALNADTGAKVWQHYTITEPLVTDPTKKPTSGPSGGPIWSAPALDPISGTLYFGTGQNYSNPATNRTDSLIAVDARTGQERWHNQLTPNDTWNVACNPELIGLPPGPYPNCPLPRDPNSGDFDIGYSPNIFFAFVKGQFRELIGVGQKSGIYHALDAKTGQIVWQTQLSVAGAGGLGGIQWGGSWDGLRLYVATNQANPGKLFALDPATGKILWVTANPSNGCSTGGAASDPVNCKLALPAAVSSIPGLVIEGSHDGKLRVYASSNGAIVWEYDTVREFSGTNGLKGKGGSINGAGASIADGVVYVNSGYAQYPGAGVPGNVLLAFSTK